MAKKVTARKPSPTKANKAKNPPRSASSKVSKWVPAGLGIVLVFAAISFAIWWLGFKKTESTQTAPAASAPSEQDAKIAKLEAKLAEFERVAAASQPTPSSLAVTPAASAPVPSEPEPETTAVPAEPSTGNQVPGGTVQQPSEPTTTVPAHLSVGREVPGSWNWCWGWGWNWKWNQIPTTAPSTDPEVERLEAENVRLQVEKTLVDADAEARCLLAEKSDLEKQKKELEGQIVGLVPFGERDDFLRTTKAEIQSLSQRIDELEKTLVFAVKEA